MEDFTRTRYRVGPIGETNDLPGGLEQKTQRCIVFSPFERGIGVALGLAFDNSDVFASAVFLGLDHPHRLAVDEQHIVGRAAVGGVFAHGNANCCAEVELFIVLNDPAGLFQLLVNLLACLGFW